MTNFNFPIRNVDALVDEFMRSRRERLSVINLDDSVRAVRIEIPDAPYTDQELASIIASKASAYGFAIDFDREESHAG